MGILEDKARARLFYKYLSTVYDRINPFVWNEAMRDEALEWFDLDEGDRVLDVGCGTGFGTEGLLADTDDVHGLDQSPHQLAQAYEKFGKRGAVAFYQGDAERLPFRDDSFDALWSSGSIEYWPNPVEALEECRRVVKPGGPVLVVGPDYPDTTLFQKLADAIMLFYDEAEADRMFRAAGFESFDHRIQQARPGSPRAITTLARVPEPNEDAPVDEAAVEEDATDEDTTDEHDIDEHDIDEHDIDEHDTDEHDTDEDSIDGDPVDGDSVDAVV